MEIDNKQASTLINETKLNNNNRKTMSITPIRGPYNNTEGLRTTYQQS